MAENSKIEWTDHTFNPWMGCTKVSDGCKFCYAEQMMDKHWGKVKWGPQGQRVKTSASKWQEPFKWNSTQWQECSRCGWRGSYKEVIYAGAVDQCPECECTHLSVVRQRVFCASLADVFEDNEQLVEWRYRLFDMIEVTTNLDWLLLTKRPQNILRMVPQRWLAGGAFPKNIWMGTSVENQREADERIGHLVQVPAVVKFLSCEPLLERVDLELRGRNYGFGDEEVKWVICGGESGPYARQMNPEWARYIRDQCVEDNVAFFFKQWGGVNKAKAGRLLDGVEWNQSPSLEVV